MTHSSEPGFLSTRPRADQAMWWWRCLDEHGAALERTPEEFPTRSEAESWLGEVYPDLAEEGVASVVLLEGDREVYGPMSLSAG